MTGARSLTQAATDNIVTMRLHRAMRPTAWYEGAILFRSAAERLGEEDAPAIDRTVAHAARLGVDGIILGGAVADPRSPIAEAASTALAQHARRIGQRVIGSIDESSDDPALLGEQARALESYGFHGVNAGRLDPGSVHLEAVTELARRIAARRSPDEFLLTGSAVGPRQDAVLDAFGDDVPRPLLRNDILWRAGWSGHALRAAIAAAARWYDATSAPLSWAIFAGADTRDPEVARLMREPLTPAGRRRLGAAALGLLALPGTIILRQGEEVGLLDLHEADSAGEVTARVEEETQRQRGVPASSYETYRTALRLRRDLELGTGPLNWVTFPDMPGEVLSFLNRTVLVVVNLADHEVEVAHSEQLLHASDRVSATSRGAIILPPETTAWITLG